MGHGRGEHPHLSLSRRQVRHSEDLVAEPPLELSLITGTRWSAVRTAWPATRPAYPFLQFCADPLNVLPSRFRFLDGDNPADPLIARKWRNILPLCPRRRVRNENLSQIRWHTVHRARGNRFLAHRFHSTSLCNVRIRPKRKANLDNCLCH